MIEPRPMNPQEAAERHYRLRAYHLRAELANPDADTAAILRAIERAERAERAERHDPAIFGLPCPMPGCALLEAHAGACVA